MSGTKDNPRNIAELCNILALPKAPKIPRGTFSRNRPLYKQLKQQQKLVVEQRLKILNPFKIGKYNDQDGNGYIKINLYLHNGIYYA